MVALVAGAGLVAPAGQAGPPPAEGLDLYRITAPPAAVERLEREGFDVAATRPDGTTEVVLGPGELSRLRAAGFRPIQWHDGRGRTVEDLARAQVPGLGPRVWKHWDGADGLRAEMDALAAAHPDLVRTEVIGHPSTRTLVPGLGLLPPVAPGGAGITLLRCL